MSGPEAVAAVVFFGGAFAVLRPLAGAVAKRIAGDQRSAAGIDAQERDAILDELEQLRRANAELAERVDFAERLLAQQREGERLLPGER